MKRSRPILFGSLILALAGLLYYFYGGGQAPVGQRPLVSITTDNLSELRREFNEAHAAIRVFVLVSPT